MFQYRIFEEKIRDLLYSQVKKQPYPKSLSLIVEGF
jgi:hypothetical protein